MLNFVKHSINLSGFLNIFFTSIVIIGIIIHNFFYTMATPLKTDVGKTHNLLFTLFTKLLTLSTHWSVDSKTWVTEAANSYSLQIWESSYALIFNGNFEVMLFSLIDWKI